MFRDCYGRNRLGSDIEGFFTEAAFPTRCDESALYIAAVGGLTLSADCVEKPVSQAVHTRHLGDFLRFSATGEAGELGF